MNPYVLLVFLLNARTLEPISVTPIAEYATAEECLKAQVGRIEHPKDGTIRYYVCRKDMTKLRS